MLAQENLIVNSLINLSGRCFSVVRCRVRILCEIQCTAVLVRWRVEWDCSTLLSSSERINWHSVPINFACYFACILILPGEIVAHLQFIFNSKSSLPGKFSFCSF